MMRSHKQAPGYGSTILAIALVYVLVLKAIFAPLSAMAQTPFGIPGVDLVICSAHEDGKTALPGSEHKHENSCCDEGCLLRLLVLAAPLLAFALFAFSRQSVARPIIFRPARRLTGPPWRMASNPNAQRAPPLVFG